MRADAVMTDIGTLIARDPQLRGGRPVIAGTGTSVRAIALASRRGDSPEEILASRPYLSIAQVHAALAYYFANKLEIDADVDEEERFYDEALRASGAPVVP